MSKGIRNENRQNRKLLLVLRTLRANGFESLVGHRHRGHSQPEHLANFDGFAFPDCLAANFEVERFVARFVELDDRAGRDVDNVADGLLG